MAGVKSDGRWSVYELLPSIGDVIPAKAGIQVFKTFWMSDQVQYDIKSIFTLRAMPYALCDFLIKEVMS